MSNDQYRNCEFFVFDIDHSTLNMVDFVALYYNKKGADQNTACYSPFKIINAALQANDFHVV